MAPHPWIPWLILFWLIVLSTATIYVLHDVLGQRKAQSAADAAICAVENPDCEACQ